MTRKVDVKEAAARQPLRGRWRLQDAKAKFSELVRLAHSEGPQHVTLHGRAAVVVVDAEEFQRLKGERTGQMLVDALAASPHRDIEIAPNRAALPVRDAATALHHGLTVVTRDTGDCVHARVPLFNPWVDNAL